MCEKKISDRQISDSDMPDNMMMPGFTANESDVSINERSPLSSGLLCVTNRILCQEDFLTRIEKLAKTHLAAILLREKDLAEEAYLKLAQDVLCICKKYNTLCILHRYANAACTLHHPALHLPLPVLRSLSKAERMQFGILGASCHSVSDAKEAEALGCTYITAGHIFDTDCKKGLPGRGLDFLQEICASATIPVYAIGGICPENTASVRAAGAAGACIMSSAMICTDVDAYLSSFAPGQTWDDFRSGLS